jgi:bifunctional UDP-N-acetylglucosamine pyrophosphorylase/glucosamine-1-phosphate N-acetyltransferase/UDP-N-acetylglucosamine pyrophosphorylase
MNATAVVLAAGKGTRMKSDLPKVLIPTAGRPMIEYLLDALEAAGMGTILVVVGYQSDRVRAQLARRPNLRFVEQIEQKGTGHAVRMCRSALESHDGPVFIVAGDQPMVQPDSVKALLQEFERSRPACLLGTACKDQPGSLGRIVRDAHGNFQAIVEAKDATPDQLLIREVNLSYYVFDREALFFALDRVTNANAQGEYYLTDCPGVLLAAGRPVAALPILKPVEALSVNTPAELAEVEAVLSAG